MNKFTFTLIAFLLAGFLVKAQETGISGRVIDTFTGRGIPDVSIQSEGLNVGTSTLEDGSFSLQLAGGEEFRITFSHPDYEEFIRVIRTVPGRMQNLGDIHMMEATTDFGDIPTMDFFDVDEDGDMASQNIIGLLSASQDLYLSQSAFKFGATRFAVRGFDHEYTRTYINGVNFNDQIRGRFNFGMVGGLNDAVRNRDVTMGITNSRYGFGDLGGLNHINTRSTSYHPGGRVTASYTNRNYTLRGMGIYSTGLMENNVAITTSIGYRWAGEGYVEGTFYNSFGYFLSVEKLLGTNNEHSLSFTTFGAPTQRGMQGPSFDEVYDLLDNTYYNPNWGYQNGEKRNARVATSYDPAVILSHVWTINRNTELMSGIGLRYNQYGTTALNWYNAADPRPDYYRYLPSYQNMPEIQELYRQQWRRDVSVRQVNWDRLYDVNRDRDRGLYMVEERHNDLMEMTFNSHFRTRVNDVQTINIGIEAKKSKGMSYKTVNDLLGAQYWLDVDQFAERDFQGDPQRIQNDMNNPNRQVREGDVFGYDYDMHVNSASIWFQNEFEFPRAELFYAAQLSYTGFYRDGNMRNGRAPENSYGKGEVHNFIDQGFKAGGNYKITGRHMVAANAIYQTKAPLPFNSYLSARTKDNAIPELSSERIAGIDASYIVAMPAVSGRISVFQTNFYDQSELNSFYHDAYRTFVNYVMTGVRKVHRGVELGASIKLTPNLDARVLGTIAEYRYQNRPTGYITYENASQPDQTETVYLKNFFVGGTPQTAGSIGLNYSHPSFTFVEVSYNYFDRNYIQLTPIRRTEAVTQFPAYSQEERSARVNEIVAQEKFDAGGTLDASIGRSFRLDGGYFLSINFNVNNILNKTDLKTGGFEQGRFDFNDYSIDAFPGKYYYSFGRNFFLNVGLRF
ncbi:carboxypeptidase-like regulatory domain-containing protein [Natronoflexus pectinivorans]|uniref:TonB-dependent receptor-like protein n=1 Tax=Natronoflexus pectinivorans TaxID=682526 RepID=A0A4R2G5L4_9BACT|nr:TonB-dependent receptor [Natronoflexus pectinivorans]TCO03008.1 TonB-dependent receptor-like protein [Natronoflexus pectinivorans]